jgi:hypothetical protein
MEDDADIKDQNQLEEEPRVGTLVQPEEEKGQNHITDFFQCLIGLSTHMVEKDLIKLFKKCTTTKDSLPIKGICKKRGGNIGFLQFKDLNQLQEFQELFATEI